MRASSSSDINRIQRIVLHLRCPWRTWQETRFHLAGIFREFSFSRY